MKIARIIFMAFALPGSVLVCHSAQAAEEFWINVMPKGAKPYGVPLPLKPGKNAITIENSTWSCFYFFLPEDKDLAVYCQAKNSKNLVSIKTHCDAKVRKYDNLMSLHEEGLTHTTAIGAACETK